MGLLPWINGTLLPTSSLRLFVSLSLCLSVPSSPLHRSSQLARFWYTPATVTAAAILALIAIPVLILGLRGRVVDDHPVCAKCKFDLVGIYPETGICPECGSELSAVGGELLERAAVIYGTRKRRPGLIKVGLAALIPAALILSAAATLAVMGRDMAYYKPTSWLTSDLGSWSSSTADAAGRELQRRIEAKGFKSAEIPAIIDVALDRQANPNRKWAIGVGDLIDSANANGQTSKAQRIRYARNALRYTIQAQPHLHSGDTLSYFLFYQARGGNDYAVRLGEAGEFNHIISLAAATLDGKALELVPNELFNKQELADVGQSRLRGGSTITGAMPSPPHLDLPPIEGDLGKHTLVLTYNIIALETPVSITPLAQWTIDLSVDFNILESNTPLVELVTDRRLGDRLKASFTFSELYARPVGLKFTGEVDADGRSKFEPGTGVGWRMNLSEPPIPVSFDVYWRQGEQEWLVTTIKRHLGMSSSGGDHRIEGYVSGPVDIVLRPSSELAIQMPSMERIWGEEIVFENVPVEIQEK